MEDQYLNPSLDMVRRTFTDSENAQEAEEIEWFYNGNRIYTDGNLLFHPSCNGTIKAVIRWKDGSCDTIIKEIAVQ